VVSESGGEAVCGGQQKPELVVGFVAPTGTSFEAVAEAYKDALGFYGYDSVRIRLSDLPTRIGRTPSLGSHGYRPKGTVCAVRLVMRRS
jgi:hypothetical protein